MLLPGGDAIRSLRSVVLLASAVLVSAAASAQVNEWDSIGQPPTGGGSFPISVYGLVFGAEDTLLAANSIGIFESPGNGTWQAVVQTPWFGGFPPYQAYLSILAEPGSPDTLLAGISNGGVYRSTDGGLSWTSSSGGSGFLAMAAGSSSPQVVYASVRLVGSFATSRSTNFGATWTELPALDATPVQVLAVDPTDSDVVYASVTPSSAGLPTGLYRSTDAGQAWTRLSGGLPDDVIKALAIDPASPGTVYAGSDANGLLRSDDRGQSWVPVNQGLGSLSVRQVVVEPTDPSTLYAGTAKGVYRSTDRGARWDTVGFHQEGTTSLTLDAASSTLYAGLVAGLGRITLAPVAPCTPGPQTLCLAGGRFRVETVWRTLSAGPSSAAQASPITDDTGAFWFFDSANLEIVLKVLDGGGVNGNFWVFYAGLSNLDYMITVTDTQTGRIQSYRSIGILQSVADTSAFPNDGPSAPATVRRPPSARSAAAAGLCVPDGQSLCQLDGRFRVRVEWQATPSGPIQTALAVALTDDTGYFWFFDASNVELVVKTLDGTAVNGHFWVFSGALSNLYYRITVTDLVTGAVETYENPFGRLQSLADTKAF